MFSVGGETSSAATPPCCSLMSSMIWSVIMVVKCYRCFSVEVLYGWIEVNGCRWVGERREEKAQMFSRMSYVLSPLNEYNKLQLFSGIKNILKGTNL